MIGADGKRLAKRHGDTRISWFREDGFTAQQLWGYLAWTAGLIDQPTCVEPADLLPVWNPSLIKTEPTIVELEQLIRLLRSI